MDTPDLHLEATEHRREDEQPVTLWHAFFAAEVPYLTHVLASYDEAAGPGLRDALMDDLLATQVAFLRALHPLGQDAGAIELRLGYSPRRRRVRIHLLGRASASERAVAADRGARLWRHLAACFPRQLYTLYPLSGDGGTGVRKILEAAEQMVELVEMRRHERHESLDSGLTGYVVFPLSGAPDSLQGLFHFLAGQSRCYEISICLQPTDLEPAERDLFATIASACRERERRAEEAVTTTVERVSVSAGDVADLYTAYLRELQSPFLMRVTVAGDGPIDAGLLGSILGDTSHPIELQDRTAPNRPGDFIAPADAAQEALARFNLRYLELFDWTPRQASPRHLELGRLRRLVDAESASSLFRLPVPPIGGLPGIDSRPPSLFEPLPEAMTMPSEGTKTLALGDAHVELTQFTQHALIAGTIGSGKTNTSVLMLYKLWSEHRVPFLVIEPVNAEHDDYRSLGRHFPIPDELRIFTLGDERTSPLRLNPFTVPDGVILNAHIAGLMACFLAALPMGDGPLPSLFREAIRNIYFARGWDPDERGGEMEREVPGLMDLRDELDWLIARRYGAKSEVAQTLIGASVTRINAPEES